MTPIDITNMIDIKIYMEINDVLVEIEKIILDKSKITANDITTAILSNNSLFLDGYSAQFIKCMSCGKLIAGYSIYGKTVIPIDEIFSCKIHIIQLPKSSKINRITMKLSDIVTDPFVRYCYDYGHSTSYIFGEFHCYNIKRIKLMREIEEEEKLGIFGKALGKVLEKKSEKLERNNFLKGGENYLVNNKLELLEYLNFM